MQIDLKRGSDLHLISPCRRTGGCVRDRLVYPQNIKDGPLQEAISHCVVNDRPQARRTCVPDPNGYSVVNARQRQNGLPEAIEQLAGPADTDSNSTLPPVAMLRTTAVLAPLGIPVTTLAVQLEKSGLKLISV